METKSETVQLTSALEDYLETIFQLIQKRNFARVKDIAKARNVKAGSVSPALKRLSELGLVEYVQREYVGLTPAGETQARRVYARHTLLNRFFAEVLRLPAEQAEEQACAMEHSLSDEAMDRLVRFFEFMSLCPEISPDLFKLFERCAVMRGDDDPVHTCNHTCAGRHNGGSKTPMSISDLKPGEIGTVVQVDARGAIRQRLLDMGILPNVQIELERVAPSGDPVWIKLEGSQMALRNNEARAVYVR